MHLPHITDGLNCQSFARRQGEEILIAYTHDCTTRKNNVVNRSIAYISHVYFIRMYIEWYMARLVLQVHGHEEAMEGLYT